MPGVGRPRPRPTSPRPRQAPPGQPRPGQPRSAPPRGPRPAGFYDAQRPGPYGYAPGPGQDPADHAAGPQVPGYPGQPGYQGQNFAGQAQPYPGQSYGRQGPQDGPATGWPPRAGRGGQPAGHQSAQEWAATEMPGQPGAVPPGQGQGGAGQYAAGQPWPGQQGPGWPGAGQRSQPEQGAYGQGQPWPPGQPGYGQGEPGQGPAGLRAGSVHRRTAGTRPVRSGARTRAGRPRPVRSGSVRPGPGAHDRTVRPGSRSDAICRGPVQQRQPVRCGTAWRHSDARAVRPAPARHRILAGRRAAAGTWRGS